MACLTLVSSCPPLRRRLPLLLVAAVLATALPPLVVLDHLHHVGGLVGLARNELDAGPKLVHESSALNRNEVVRTRLVQSVLDHEAPLLRQLLCFLLRQLPGVAQNLEPQDGMPPQYPCHLFERLIAARLHGGLVLVERQSSVPIQAPVDLVLYLATVFGSLLMSGSSFSSSYPAPQFPMADSGQGAGPSSSTDGPL
eukprot:CAMPEP_0175234396 /NCGR_PEP_ID=MMETSP0093-20121207/26961_1 /TAXON_ID=311494 /ORGANISM="Alexandrium monilatum, Strain CCMP3105" /LENGTH=196 /DNA_ID=CAMNT_0016528299 /DNA_START=16 /DNA_END=604 /DNA_ORIENTATION=+